MLTEFEAAPRLREWACDACRYLFAAERVPADGLCDACREDDIHSPECGCDRCYRGPTGSDQDYWRRASADGRPM